MRVVIGLTVAVGVSGLAPGPAAADPLTASDTEQELRAAGFQEVRVFYSLADDRQGVLVRYSPAPTTSRPDAEATIAGVVWRTEELRFDEVVVVSGPNEQTTFGYDQLAAILGPRPAGFDQLPLVVWGTGVPLIGTSPDRDRESLVAIAPLQLLAVAVTVMAAAMWLGVLWLAVSPREQPNGSTLFS